MFIHTSFLETGPKELFIFRKRHHIIFFIFLFARIQIATIPRKTIPVSNHHDLLPWTALLRARITNALILELLVPVISSEAIMGALYADSLRATALAFGDGHVVGVAELGELAEVGVADALALDEAFVGIGASTLPGR